MKRARLASLSTGPSPDAPAEGGGGAAKRARKEAKETKAALVSPSEACWLVKSEPDPRAERGVMISFSIDDLEKCAGQREVWTGVRNYGARNHLRSMKLGDRVLFYHSNCKVPGVVGVCEVVREGFTGECRIPHSSPPCPPV
jgi:hypothetical protein